MLDEQTKVLLCFNAPASIYANYSGKERGEGAEPDDLSETAFEAEIKLVENALRESYREVHSAAITSDLGKTIQKLSAFRPDVVVNLVESVEGNAEYEAYHAGLYELMKISYTGNVPLCLGNCLNKFRAKHLLKARGIPVPKAVVVYPDQPIEPEKLELRYPVITKLLQEDASIGISENSVVLGKESLESQCRFLFSQYNQPVLVEEYIDGREFNVAVLGDEVLPVSEISFAGLPENFPKIVTYEGKWMAESVYYKHTVPVCPAEISDELRVKLQALAKNAFAAMQCRDYARVDMRVDADENVYVIEVNPNPDISSDAGFARAARHAGYSYAQLLRKIVEFARERN